VAETVSIDEYLSACHLLDDLFDGPLSNYAWSEGSGEEASSKKKASSDEEASSKRAAAA